VTKTVDLWPTNVLTKYMYFQINDMFLLKFLKRIMQLYNLGIPRNMATSNV